ncbi:hypothetical protein HS7_03730 [Sulfolobales archaeon HS-7]|nr:hypothetical protein HS7_03730 [Sulfolobales archaeon HS-7]
MGFLRRSKTTTRRLPRNKSKSTKIKQVLEEKLLLEEFSGTTVKEIVAQAKVTIASILSELNIDAKVESPKVDSDLYESLSISIPITISSRTKIKVKLLLARRYYDDIEGPDDNPKAWRAIISGIE